MQTTAIRLRITGFEFDSMPVYYKLFIGVLSYYDAHLKDVVGYSEMRTEMFQVVYLLENIDLHRSMFNGGLSES